jgi:predicted ArsR family transcriptional regulator
MSDLPEIPEEDEIPLLEDVVTPEELERESEYIVFDDAEPEEIAAAPPKHDEVLLAMRDDILAQLQADLHPLIVRSVEQAIHEALERATLTLHNELTRPLEERLRTLIEERMEEEFGPRQHPDKGKDEDKSP